MPSSANPPLLMESQVCILASFKVKCICTVVLMSLCVCVDLREDVPHVGVVGAAERWRSIAAILYTAFTLGFTATCNTHTHTHSVRTCKCRMFNFVEPALPWERGDRNRQTEREAMSADTACNSLFFFKKNKNNLFLMTSVTRKYTWCWCISSCLEVSTPDNRGP